ncbi:hypothetical protein NMY22_g3821 [Coprinellus aureogranulatus]|nr:hypothetical protein NMY22_g3821 [Coprinellus aureogranulatus]
MEYFLDNNSWEYIDKLVKRYDRVFRITGILKSSYLFVYDPKALQFILKERDVFEESEDLLRSVGKSTFRHPFNDQCTIPRLNRKVFGDGLLSTVGDHHRKQRKLLNPAFSAAHMRELTPTFYSVVHKLENSIAHQVADGEKEIDMLHWMSRTALEIMAQSGYGYSFDSLEPGAEEHPYATSAKNYFRVSNDPSILLARFVVYPYIHRFGSPQFQRALASILPWKTLHQLRDIVDVMHTTSVDIFKDAKRAIRDGKDTSERPGGGKDIMSILIKANMNASEEDRLPDDELIAQISTLTLAAMDTTSNALARILSLLSENPEAQKRLRQEVTEAFTRHGGDLDFDSLNGLSYLDAVIKESLRYHTPIAYLPRQATCDTILPVGKPIKTVDGGEINEIFVPKGQEVFMSLFDCNRDPEIWGPDADQWKPDRWLSPLPVSVAEAHVPGIYSNLTTFIGGGRACIGFRFSLLEMKIVLSVMIQRFEFSPTGKKVVWLCNGVTQPTIEDLNLPDKGRNKTQLPLQVRLL